jgi:hypothetical protein
LFARGDLIGFLRIVFPFTKVVTLSSMQQVDFSSLQGTCSAAHHLTDVRGDGRGEDTANAPLAFPHCKCHILTDFLQGRCR